MNEPTVVDRTTSCRNGRYRTAHLSRMPSYHASSSDVSLSPFLCFPFQYVRREIRQLTERDRETFFDAMETLYRLPTAEGNEIYGDEYKVRWVTRHYFTVDAARNRKSTRVGNGFSTGGD